MSAANAVRRKRQPMTVGETGRQLRRCTWGNTYDQLLAASGQRMEQWVDAQLAIAYVPEQPSTAMSTSRLPGFAAGPTLAVGQAGERFGQFVTWKGYQPEKLRTRLTWALWELFSIGGAAGDVAAHSVGFADFWEILEGAVHSGTWRSMLEGVCKSQLMARWLTFFQNEKTDGVRQPDENYAREIMQLFSLGLWELRQDGTRRLSGELAPADPRYVASGTAEVPSYVQSDIANVARIFTGMVPPVPGTAIATVFTQAWRTPGSSTYDDGAGRTGWRCRLTWSPTHHEAGLAKQALSGAVNIPIGTDGQTSLTMFLDALEGHPCTAPFFSKTMIRLLTTSNPSPGYVSRVASAFKNDGSGQVGNLRAVFKAILLDQEALAPASKGLTARAASYEEQVFQQLFSTGPALTAEGAPIAQGSGVYPGSATAHIYSVPGMAYPSAYAMGQNPSVFGRWGKEFRAPGEIFNLGLVSPELATLTEGSISQLLGSSTLNLKTGHKASAQDRADCLNAANHAAMVNRWCATVAGDRPDASFRSAMVTYLGTRVAMATEDNVSETLVGLIYQIVNTPWGNVRT